MHDPVDPPSVPSTGSEAAPTAEEIRALDAYWRAANYLAVGQIYLLDNALLREPLRAEHIKPRLLGHWGTSPGLNFVYAHLNRVINRRAAHLLYICGPGHGGPAMVANAWLEGTYSELYSHVDERRPWHGPPVPAVLVPGGNPEPRRARDPRIDQRGRRARLRRSPMPTARPSTTPTLVVACVVGDGEAETGALATSWHANKFLDPVGDGAVLPILHLNGYKIANPTVLARIPEDELSALFTGYGYHPLVVEGGFDGEDPLLVHERMAIALDVAFDEIAGIWSDARSRGVRARPAWPMIILRTPKGWTGPKFVDGVAVEGTWRAHQVPLGEVRTNPAHLAQLEEWMRSYRSRRALRRGRRGRCPPSPVSHRTATSA